MVDTELDLEALSKTFPCLDTLQIRIVCKHGRHLKVHNGMLPQVRALSLHFITGIMVPNRTVFLIVQCFPSIVDVSLRFQNGAYEPKAIPKNFPMDFANSLRYLTIDSGSRDHILNAIEHLVNHRAAAASPPLKVLHILPRGLDTRTLSHLRNDPRLYEACEMLFCHGFGKPFERSSRVDGPPRLPRVDHSMLTRMPTVREDSQVGPSDVFMLWQRAE